MIGNYTQVEVINAFKIVKEVVSNNNQAIDYFYSGDKDTRIEAMSNTFRHYGKPSYYELSVEELQKYDEMYHDDIDKEFNCLVNFGKTESKNGEIALAYIEKLFELYSNNMNKS